MSKESSTEALATDPPGPGRSDSAEEPREEISPGPGRVASGITLSAIVVIGAVVRARVAFQASIFPYDAYYYLSGAETLGHHLNYGFRGAAQTRFPPGYPIFVAPLTRLTDASTAGIWVAIGAWCAVAIVTYFIAKLVASSLGGIGWQRCAGLIAAAFVTAHPVGVKWASVPLSEPVFALFYASSVLAALEAMRRQKLYLLAVAGALGGYAAITRFESLSLVGVIGLCSLFLLFDAISKRSEKISVMRLIGWAAAAGVLFIAPPLLWYLRNRGLPQTQLAYSDELTQNLDINASRAVERFKYFAWSGQRTRVGAVVAYMGMLIGIVRLKREMFVITLWAFSFIGGHVIWYYVYERFLMGAIPALAIAAAYLITGCIWLSGRMVREKYRRPMIIGGAVLASVAVIYWCAASLATGAQFAREHIESLNRDWGGETFATTARAQRDSGVRAAGNDGAAFTYLSGQNSPFIGPVAFDRDEIPHGDPARRVEYLRSLGIRRIVLNTQGNDPVPTLGLYRLDPAQLELEAVVSVDAPLEGMNQRTAIFRIKDADPGKSVDQARREDQQPAGG